MYPLGCTCRPGPWETLDSEQESCSPTWVCVFVVTIHSQMLLWRKGRSGSCGNRGTWQERVFWTGWWQRRRRGRTSSARTRVERLQQRGLAEAPVPSRGHLPLQLPRRPGSGRSGSASTVQAQSPGPAEPVVLRSSASSLTAPGSPLMCAGLRPAEGAGMELLPEPVPPPSPSA